MQHLARASGVPLSLPIARKRAYIESVRASPQSCPCRPSDVFSIAGTSFPKARPGQGAPLSFGPHRARDQTKSQRKCGMFHETRNGPML